jgi:RNA polymerase sigma factor (sigma-70 family)
MKLLTVSQDEQRLAQGCAANRPAAQEELFNRYYRKMFGVCLRFVKDRDQAEDVLQDGFIKVFKKIGDYKGEGSLEGWVRRIMVNCAIEHYRKNNRFITIDESYAPEETDTAADSVSSMAAEEILALVQELPSGYRTVFNLFAIEGYGHQEIADMLGISTGTSKSQLFRAREILAEKINKSGRIRYGNA